MKIKYKKYLYLLNDVTNILLKKEKEKLTETANKLRIALIVCGVLLLLSIIINIYLLIS